MMKLVTRFKAEYCNFNSVSVRFYDIKKLDRMPDPPPHPLLDWESKTLMRGYYNLDRNKKEEELNFKPAKPDTEISVIFKPDGYCVTETDIGDDKKD